jgi:23S rRNA (cytosine1962-C5)-methyltransferase
MGVAAQRLSARDVKTSPPRLRCRLKPAAESAVRRGHPWIFSESIIDQNRDGEAGELAVVYDRQDRFLAVGLFDSDSPLRIRVLHVGKPAQVDEKWWREHLNEALARREGILDAETTACRLINGESDGWPGLVLDRYEAVLVMKLYTGAWINRVPELMSLLRERLEPRTLVSRLSRNVQAAFAGAGYHDAQILFGERIEAPVVFAESGLRFEADVLAGQKTGFFLDQRENRREVEKLARGRDVLNAFSFTGGFSLYAARGGARTVASLDISSHALAGAQRNFGLNKSDLAIARCGHEIIQANAFDWLEQNSQRTFDLIVLDPPSLAKRETERAGAIRAYGNLAASAIQRLRRKGTLVAASCSAHVSVEEFFGAVKQAASKRKFSVLNTTGHAPDHRATFPEGEYLKCIYLQFEP